MASIGYPRMGEYFVGVGAANYLGATGGAVGFGKSWLTEGDKIKEVTVKVLGFASEKGADWNQGVAGSVNLHF